MNTAPADLKYHPFYCEENIWQLCHHPDFHDGYAVFIASEGDCFPMFYQSSGEGNHHLIYWDYHVVMLRNGIIYDFDTTLGFATPLTTYLQYSLPDKSQLAPDMVAQFRVVDASQFLAFFQSDRRHMRINNRWSAAPPPWPAISQHHSNLEQFNDIQYHEYGEILSAEALIQRFASPVT